MSDNGSDAGSENGDERSAVLIPLYIYPVEGAWDVLHEAIEQHPNVDFVIVINCDDGPGEGDKPDEDYSRELPRLTQADNVRIVGYVRTDWSQRDLSEVCQDIAKYAAWGEEEDFAVHGIFFDEASNEYSQQADSFLKTVAQEVKTRKGFVGDRITIFNPGCPPDARLEMPGPDISVAFEESYEEFRQEERQENLQNLAYDRTRYSYIIHSVPIDEIPALIDEIRPRSQYLFVTDLTEDYYNSFGPSFMQFIEALDIGGGDDEEEN